MEAVRSNLETTICALPDEILEMIFKEICLKELKTLTLVDKRWLNLISNRFVFEETNFFKTFKTDGEIEMFCKCNRRFSVVPVNLISENSRKVEALDHILQNNHNARVLLNFGNNSFSKSFVSTLFKTVAHCKDLTIKIQSTTDIEVDCSEKIEFKNLKCLSIFVYSIDFYVLTNFLRTMEVPALERLFVLSADQEFPVCENVFSILRQNPKKLNEVTLTFGRGSEFVFINNAVVIKRCEEIKLQIIEFLRPHIKKVKEVDVTNNEGVLHAFILNEAENLEDLRTDVNLLRFDENFKLEKVTFLEIWSFEANDKSILGLCNTFPNLVEIRFCCPKPHDLLNFNSLRMHLDKLKTVKFRILQQ